MTSARLLRPASEVRPGPLAGRLLGPYLVSLLLHALLLIGFAGGWLGSSPRSDSLPVYTVDLVHKPVLNPQAGRPEPRTASPAAGAAPNAAKLNLPDKHLPAEKPSARAADSHVNEALQKLREEQALQQKFAALRQGQTVPAEIRVGMPNAKGTEEGVDASAYIHSVLQSNWALSSYQLIDSIKAAKIEAWVVLTYSKSGRLEGFRFDKESGDIQFDESIKRALVKSQQLPQPLPARMENIRAIFNLKEMKASMGAR